MSKFTCEQVEPLLSAYRDGEMLQGEREDIEKHVADCAVCQNRLLELDAVVAALKALPRFEPKVDYAANIERLISASPQRAKSTRKPVLWGVASVAAAIAVFAFGMTKSGINLAPLTASNTNNVKVDQVNSNKNEVEIANAPVEKTAPTETPQGNVHSKEQTIEANQHNKKNNSSPEEQNKPSNENHKKNGRFNPRLEVASKPNVGGDSVPTTASPTGALLAANEVPLIASEPKISDRASDSNIVAVYETDQKNVTEELGINTDEDGLYAIKL